MKKKICIITGTRADYGHLAPVMKAIRQNHHLELQVVATCMHLMKEFGHTIDEIRKDGFRINASVDVSYQEDSGKAMAISVGKGIIGMAEVFNRIKPDLVLVLGDRGEMLAAAIAANYLNIPVAHLHGGEITGHVDGIVRHAITKLSHLHFPATKGTRDRIIRLGEEPWRVKDVGAPTLDKILWEKLPGEKELRHCYSLGEKDKFFLVVQHPVSTDVAIAGKQMIVTLDAAGSFGIKTLLIYPNADAGGRAMIREIIKRYRSPNLMAYKSLPHQDFLGLMKIASVLIGNSSSGIIEAPSFKLPVVNVGTRQAGRERGCNVIDVPHEKSAIVRAVNKALYDKKFIGGVKQGQNPYGDGRASQRIVKVLSAVKLSPQLLQKKITY